MMGIEMTTYGLMTGLFHDVILLAVATHQRVLSFGQSMAFSYGKERGLLSVCDPIITTKRTRSRFPGSNKKDAKRLNRTDGR